MKNLILSSFTIFATVVAVFTLSTIRGHLKDSSQQTITLRQRLEEIGEKFDRHFTLEIVVDAERVAATMERESLIKKPLRKTLSQELEQLRQTIPNLDYKVNETSKVIRVIDKRVVKRSNYALEQVVRDISFDGRMFDFVNEIGKKGPAVSSRGMVDTYEALGGDYTIRVNIQANNKTVRELLTNYISLEGRGKILWIATTYTGKDSTTYIRYLK